VSSRDVRIVCPRLKDARTRIGQKVRPKWVRPTLRAIYFSALITTVYVIYDAIPLLSPHNPCHSLGIYYFVALAYMLAVAISPCHVLSSLVSQLLLHLVSTWKRIIITW
jgi:hypothetical protein